MPNSEDLVKKEVNSDSFIKKVLIIGVVLVLGSFVTNLFSIFGPYLEMRKNLNEMKKTLSEAKSNIESSRVQLDSIVTNINTYNRFIDSVKLRVELIDRSLTLKSINFTQATIKHKLELQKMEDSLRNLLKENKFGIPDVVDP